MRKLISSMLCLTLIFGCFTAVAEESRVFILCNPRTPVNVRRSPKKGSDIVGWLDFGDEVETDGVIRNGYIRVYGIGEYGVGWVHAGYVVEDPPERVDAFANVAATGRVTSYRRIGGKRNKWLAVGDEVKVYGLSEEWAVTNKGYIRTKYLEVFYE